MQDFRNLAVWQRARIVAVRVYEVTASYPKAETFGLTSQMRRASVSICANIAEGCGRRGDREFRRFVDVAMGSACELECEVVLSADLGLLTMPVQEQMLDIVQEVKRMLSGLVKQLNTHNQG
jgi:four helix bundle protein